MNSNQNDAKTFNYSRCPGGTLILYLSTQINLQHVFNLSAFGTYACFEFRIPLVNGSVDVVCCSMLCSVLNRLSSQLKGKPNNTTTNKISQCCHNDVSVRKKNKSKQAVRPVVGPPHYAPAPCKWWLWVVHGIKTVGVEINYVVTWTANQSSLVTLTFDLESGVRVMCDVGYLCANFSFPTTLCSRLRPDVRDRQTLYVRRQTDVRQHHRLMPRLLGAGHNKTLVKEPIWY